MSSHPNCQFILKKKNLAVKLNQVIFPRFRCAIRELPYIIYNFNIHLFFRLDKMKDNQIQVYFQFSFISGSLFIIFLSFILYLH